MKTNILLSLVAMSHFVFSFGQNSIELTFTAIDSLDYIQFDSIKVINRTQGGDTVLFYPDTILLLDNQVGISEINRDKQGFEVFQNYPNPITDHTTISFYIPERDMVNMIVTDMQGQSLIETKRILDKGYHSCHFAPGNGSLFLFMAQWRGYRSSIKIIKTNSFTSETTSFEYIGKEEIKQYKSLEEIQNFAFDVGDELLYIGYIDTLESIKYDSPEASNTYHLQFAYNIPCIDTPVITYEGQEYNTVQVFNQCWLKENINMGTMIPGSQAMTDNNIIEKYCYNNEPDSCNIYGGLYQWNELMQYTTLEGSQGICPPGWHLPTDEEWNQLQGAVDSEYGYPDPVWNGIGTLGYDAGKNLKSQDLWIAGGNGVDKFAVRILPGGSMHPDSSFIDLGSHATFWTSSNLDYDDPYYRIFSAEEDGVIRYVYDEEIGFSCRCVKD